MSDVQTPDPHGPQAPMIASRSMTLTSPSPPPEGAMSAGQQSWFASFAHWLSQSVLQQNGSAAQTASQQAASLQAVLGCGVKQLPVPAPPHSVQTSCASSAQRGSQWSSQQKGSIAHTAEQHNSLLQPGDVCGAKQLPVPGHEPAMPPSWDPTSSLSSGAATAPAAPMPINQAAMQV